MANHLSVCIYGQNGNDWAVPTGIYYGFPREAVVFIPLHPTVEMGTVTMNSKIKVLNTTDPYLTAPEFFTDRTVDDLITESNT